jgi:hypothetical protein
MDPAALALAYVSNSTILRFFADMGVNLDPFFKLLWRHVFTVAILERHFKDTGQRPESGGLLASLRRRFSGESRDDRSAREALNYLESWGSEFWVETEYKVKEITRKLEQELTTAAAGQVDLGAVSARVRAGGGAVVTDEQREELRHRGQAIVSKTQVHELNRIIDVLDTVLGSTNRTYNILIDRLDEGWVEDRLRYRLIMALIVTARDFIRVQNAKVVIAMRRDLLERVFRLSRDAGFQEEKYESLYVRLAWNGATLLQILDRRVGALVRSRYTAAPVSYRDVLPARYQNENIGPFITRRATRPRDVIDFFNMCIQAGTGHARLSTKELKIAEGEYSRSRLRALGDEWSADYPRLLDYARVLRGRPDSFKVGTITANELADLCLTIVAEHPDEEGLLHSASKRFVDADIDDREFCRSLIQMFYKIGLVGLKLGESEKPTWSDDRGRSVSAGEITDRTSVVVHPMYHRALGVVAKKRSRGP